MIRFERALMYVQNGGRARRQCWARVQDYTRATPPLQIEHCWRIWMSDSDIVCGWGGSVGCADDNDPVRDGMLYSPTDEDRLASDWELLS